MLGGERSVLRGQVAWYVVLAPRGSHTLGIDRTCVLRMANPNSDQDMPSVIWFYVWLLLQPFREGWRPCQLTPFHLGNSCCGVFSCDQE